MSLEQKLLSSQINRDCCEMWDVWSHWRTSIWALRSQYRAGGHLHPSQPGPEVGDKKVCNWGKGESCLKRCCLSPTAPVVDRDIPPFTCSAMESHCVLMWLFFWGHAALQLQGQYYSCSHARCSRQPDHHQHPLNSHTRQLQPTHETACQLSQIIWIYEPY